MLCEGGVCCASAVRMERTKVGEPCTSLLAPIEAEVSARSKFRAGFMCGGARGGILKASLRGCIMFLTFFFFGGYVIALLESKA